jgi:hypothetical protein
MKNYWQLSWLVLFFGFSCPQGCERPSHTITDFKDYYSYAAKYDPNQKELVVSIHLEPGIHAYAQGEKIGRPVSVKIDPINNWRAMGAPKIPPGHTKTLTGQATSVLQGDFEIRQPIVEGKGPGQGKLFLQVCSENQCDRPLTHEIGW